MAANLDPILVRAHAVSAIQNRLATLASRVPMPPEGAADQHHIGYQLFGLAFTHALAIVTLISMPQEGMAASAFAMVRPMMETLQRAWWFSVCATGADARRYLERDEFAGGTNAQVAAAIDAQPPFAGTQFFTGIDRGEWGLYHSFTHGGCHALAIYGHRPSLDPHFDPAVILSVLDNAGKMSAMAAMGMCWTCEPYAPEAVAPIYRQVLAMGPEVDAPPGFGAPPAA